MRSTDTGLSHVFLWVKSRMKEQRMFCVVQKYDGSVRDVIYDVYWVKLTSLTLAVQFGKVACKAKIKQW